MLPLVPCFPSSLVGLLVALVFARAIVDGSDTMCRDEPDYSHWGNTNRDCDWIAKNNKCDWSSDNKVVGDAFCPVSCDRCSLGPVTLDEISVDKSCYNYGDPIVVLFTNQHPEPGDWIGIFPESVISMIPLNAEPELWLRACGDQDDECKVSYGMVTFGRGLPEGTGVSTFPLAAGTYIAFMLRDGWVPYEVYAGSSSFTIQPDGESCHPRPSPAQHPEASPPPHSYRMPNEPASPSANPAPAPAPHSTLAPVRCVDEYITTDKTCYNEGEAIKITFNQCHPDDRDWIAVYRADDGGEGDDLGDDFRMWVWACGDQDCRDATAASNITLDENDPKESGGDSWPLPVNKVEGYRVHLMRYDQTSFVSYLASPKFVVLSRYESCNREPTPEPHPNPCVDSVEVDDTCYSQEAGDVIALTFTNCDSKRANWVGIYDAHDDPDDLGTPLYWVWLCGDQNCREAIDSGTIFISNSVLVEEQLQGEYRAHLIASANPTAKSYSAYASSEVFRIERTDRYCQ